VTAAHPGTAGTTAAGDRDPFLDPACQLVVAWTSPIICDFDGALRQASASLEEFRGEDERFATALAAFTTSSLEKTVVCYDTQIAAKVDVANWTSGYCHRAPSTQRCPGQDWPQPHAGPERRLRALAGSMLAGPAAPSTPIIQFRGYLGRAI
jgi:hypothetical protein